MKQKLDEFVKFFEETSKRSNAKTLKKPNLEILKLE